MKKIVLSAVLAVPASYFAQKDSLNTARIEEVVFQKKVREKITDITSVGISTKDTKNVVSFSGGIEGILKTLPSVNSNTELSSQYMVRGGSYDENLIYINDIEINRPFLIRNSQQEGMSIINPDMVSLVSFSAGGFEAKYGDKMSSALNIYYREPEKFEISGEGSLIGGRLTAGYGSENKKFSALVSGRYRNTNLVLKTLGEDSDFFPKYMDLQAYLNYHFNPKLSISFIGYYGNNDYKMVPKVRETEFGSLQTPIKVTTYYNGQEDDKYKNMMGTATITYKPNEKLKISLDNFATQNREREYFTIGSAYLLQTVDPVTGDPITTYDTGGQIDHARNDLFLKTYGSHLKAHFSPNLNTDFEAGVKFVKENLRDLTNEYQLLDSLGYSSPRPMPDPGTLDASLLELNYAISGDNHITPTRLSAYAQFSKKFMWGSSKAFVNAGVRASNWSFNKETIFSPRVQFAIKPDWNADMLFKLSGGVYYQQPFYKEIKGLDGSFLTSVKSQRSIQAVLSNDYEFYFDDRPFKLTTEIYYKKLDHLIPYYMDNVRIRYTGENNATGYAYGIDTRLYGEFVPGIDSWLSASYARAYQNIDNRGDIPLPTDQRFRFAMFYQDYMPKFPKMRVNLTGVFAMGLPNGAPLFSDPYQYVRNLPSYKRVDIGLSYVFVDGKKKNDYYGFLEKFDELSLGLQVFNAFNIRNTVANQWITDVSSDAHYIYPIPVRLTGRFFNVKLEFRIK